MQKQKNNVFYFYLLGFQSVFSSRNQMSRTVYFLAILCWSSCKFQKHATNVLLLSFQISDKKKEQIYLQ